MSTNNSNTDTHIYNIINNPPKEFTEPCECCGVSEFQLGVRHAEQRIKQEILGKLESISFRHDKTTYHLNGFSAYMSRDAKSISIEELMDALIKGKTNG